MTESKIFDVLDFLYVKMQFACFGLLAKHNVVIAVSPIAKYTIGWSLPRAWIYFLVDADV